MEEEDVEKTLRGFILVGRAECFMMWVWGRDGEG